MNSLRADSQHVHPTAEAWRRFIEGRSHQDEAASMERHLVECQSCVTTLEMFAGQADKFLARLRSLHTDSPVPPIAATLTLNEPPVADDSERIIGPYKLLQKLGEGGMGVVYMAEQTEPVRRRVALKIIKPGMGSGKVIARFEAERQALAMMDHQNIARVLDAGTTDSGRPYFVMELVKGVPITEYCDSNKLPVAQRLALFVPICQAIQHAHQKGIIHRDIKPSNVMVTLYDGQPVPKVIDFGVAKATEQRLTERTMFTQYGQVIGTLEYMSPEQAEMSGLDIDTRSDIYSLGVLLYELLTGSTPISKDQLAKAGLVELLRMIREHEPERPSTRLSHSHATLPTITAQRQSDPKRLSLLIRGELDWIVMKALDKDRTRRYETANGLARDIERYLHDEPVEACPPSARYRLSKFARRNRGVLLTVTAFAALLIAGIVVSSSLAVRATLAERSAELERNDAVAGRNREADLRRQADALRQQSDAARTQAEDDRDTAVRITYYSAMNQAAQQAHDEPRGASVARVVDQWRLAPMRGDPRGWEWHLLNSPLDNEALMLRGHMLDCRSAAWSPDARYLASAGFNDAVRVWCTRIGNEVAVFPAGTAIVVAWSPDGKFIAAGNAHGQLLLFDSFEGGASRVSQLPASFPRTLSWSPDSRRIACGMENRTIEIREAETFELVASATQDHTARLVRWSPDGKWIASTSENGVRIWDDSLGSVRDLTGHTVKVVGLHWGRGDTQLWSAGEDGSIAVWDVATGESLRSVTCAGVEAFAADWNPDGTEIAFCGAARITLADTRTSERLAEWPAERGVFGGFGELIQWSDDGTRLSMALSGWAAPVPVWDVETMKRTHGTRVAEPQVAPPPMHQRPWIDWSSDGKTLASSTNGVSIWDADQLQLKRRIDLGDVPTSCGRISPDGQLLAVAFLTVSEPDSVRVYRVADGSLAWVAAVPGGANGVSWSADGQWLAVTTQADGPGPIRVWDVQGEPVQVDFGATMNQSLVEFASAGRQLALADNYSIVLRTADSKDDVLVMRGENYAKNYLHWSRDGQRLACNMSDGLIRVAPLQPGSAVIRLEGHSYHVSGLDWSWDDSRLASVDPSGTLKVWDVAEGREILSFANRALALAWDPTGPRLAYLDANSGVNVLDAAPSYDRESPPEYLSVLERRSAATPDNDAPTKSRAAALARAGQWERAVETLRASRVSGRETAIFQPGWWALRSRDADAWRELRGSSANDESLWPAAARWFRPIEPANGFVPFDEAGLVYVSRLHVPEATDAAVVIGDSDAETLLLNDETIRGADEPIPPRQNRMYKLVRLRAGWNLLQATVPADLEDSRFVSFNVRVSIEPVDLALAYAAAGQPDQSAASAATVREDQRNDPRLLRASLLNR